jgi:tetratricopeptide (TPR) repeat protein
MEDIRLSAEYLDRAMEIITRIQDKSTEINLLSAQSMAVERAGDYYRLLVDFETRRVELCREIGDKLSEGFVLSSLAQAKGLYLGDYQAALVDVRRAFRLTRKLASSLYPLLRTIQLHAMMGNFEQAQKDLGLAYQLAEKATFDLGRGAVRLNDAILCTLRGTEADCRRALELVDYSLQLVYQSKISRQYQMAACCISTTAHLALAEMLQDEDERRQHREQALRDAQTALDVYQGYGFVQIIECFSEEIHFRNGLALAANGLADEARLAFERATHEMMRKYALIPEGSPYRVTYLENIDLHRQILAAYPDASANPPPT